MNPLIDLPVPPLSTARAETAVSRGEQVVLELVDGRKLIGKLDKFDSDKGSVGITPDGASKPKSLGMHELRLMRIPQPRRWVRDDDSRLSHPKGVRVSSEPLEFDIEFSDQSSINGTTFGFRNGRHGIHLFPVQDTDQYTHLFVPNNAIVRHRIGKHLAQQSNKDKVISARDVAMVLLEPELMSAAPLEELGALLSEHGAAPPAAIPDNPAHSLWTGPDFASIVPPASASSHPVLGTPALEMAPDLSPPTPATSPADNGQAEMTGALRELILEALHQNAGVIHFESADHRGARIRLRKNGDLVDLRVIAADKWGPLIEKLKTLSGVDSMHSDARAGVLDSNFMQPFMLDIHIAFIATTNGGEDVVLKISPRNHTPALGEMGLSEGNFKRLDELSLIGSGLFLICGPARSETSALIYALLIHLNTGHKKIWVLGDGTNKLPEPIRQVRTPQMNEEGIDILLNADPDIVLIENLFDTHLSKRLVSAALAGPQVLASLPAASSGKAVERLINMGVPRHELADALSTVLAQRNAKRLCTHCKKHYVPTLDELRSLAAEYHSEAISDDTPKQIQALRDKTLATWKDAWVDTAGQLILFRAVGCKHCHKSGYEGHVPLHEMLEMSAPVRQALLSGANATLITRAAMGTGMKTLRQDGIEKALQGHTDLIQIRAVCAR